MSASLEQVEALVFDVFGTVVDWRGSLIRQFEAFGAERGLEGVDWTALVDAWRGRYKPSMQAVRAGERPWTALDDLHAESLETLLPDHGLAGRLSQADRDWMVRGWHRLDPWPDSLPGLRRLRERFLLAPLSNGNVGLMARLARHAGLPWDCVLGAEVARHYKPDPEVYLTGLELLRLPPERVMLVAAHNYDLAEARRHGMRTAFVRRASEYGPAQREDLAAESDWDLAVENMEELADALPGGAAGAGGKP